MRRGKGGVGKDSRMADLVQLDRSWSRVIEGDRRTGSSLIYLARGQPNSGVKRGCHVRFMVN